MKIIIKGRVASKKNSKNVGRNKHTGKTFVTSSSAWKKFEQDALWQIKQQFKWEERFVGKKVRIEYIFITKGQETIDCDNAMAGINDLLQKEGFEVIDNDKNIKQWAGVIVNGWTEWITQITIMEITDRWNPIEEMRRDGVLK